MAVMFDTLIARNRRNSAILIAVFILIFVALGLTIGRVWTGQWEFGLYVAVGAAALAFLLTLFSYFGGANAILAMSKARKLDRQEDPQLFNVVEEMAIAAGLPMPQVYVIDDTALNAFATGRNPRHAVLAITQGLRQKLNRDELQGVMAHEICHIRNSDILFAMLMAVLVGSTVLLADAFLRSMWYGRGHRSSSNRRRGGGGAADAILIVLAIVFAAIAPLLARIIQMAMSRQREYLADASAVALTRNPEGLARALEKLQADQETLEVANRATAHLYIVNPVKKFEARASTMLASHPPLQDRVARIRSTMF